MILSRKALVPFATALVIAASAPAPASAQGGRTAAAGGASERWESFKDDAGGFFGGLFGGSERVGPQQQQDTQYQGGGGYQGGGYQGGGYQGGRGGDASPSDLTVRLDRIENQLRQLTGTLEQLQFRNQQLEQQLKRAQDDNEFRFQELGGRTGAARPRANPPGPPAQAAPPASQQGPGGGGRRSDAFDPNETPGAPGAPQPLGSLPAGRPSAPTVAQAPNTQIYEEERPVGGQRGSRQGGDPLDLSTLSDRAANDPDLEPYGGPQGQANPRFAAVPSVPAGAGAGAEPRQIPGALPAPPPRNPNATAGSQQASLPPGATSRDELALAQGFVQRRDYALAEDGLRDFLKKYPNDRQVSDAHYLLGETMFQRQRYRDAAESFLTVSTKYESSGRAPDALLRLGQSLAALGEKEAACATLNEVVRKFPRASNGVKQGVEREQKRARC